MNAMDRLAEARPASLDCDGPSPERRYRDLEAALSQPVAHMVARGGRTRRRLVVGLVGMAAVGTAAAVAIAATDSGVPRRSHKVATPRSHEAKPGGPIMLAADKTELLPIGRYWHTDQVVAQSYIVKAATGDYAISGTGSESYEWIGAKPGDGELFYGRHLSFRPLTPADKAAWQRAGSPHTLRVWAGDHFDTVVDRHGGWEADRPQATAGGKFTVPGLADKTNGGGATIEQLQAFTADPEAFAKKLIDAWRRSATKQGFSGANPKIRAFEEQRRSTPGMMLMDIGFTLLNTPLTPKLQAAVMRELARQPGVRQIGSVTDPLGRPAVALAGAELRQNFDWGTATPAIKDVGYGSEDQLLFDPATGAFLGTQLVLTEPGGLYAGRQPGFVINYWVSRSIGWTDKKPTPPAEPPF